ncbi:MAG TPA: chromosome segregation protein SMC [Candidatus Scatovivens faecipullorum]|nr:chromosome segregation protein SMC [Candidatus Scatovivens faecipullorum]
MYLKRLEMYGFKSFADKTVLDFMPGITTVIGPNGSGKSNISDCIRWVLGEQSLKSLRGTKSEDIIFAGTQNRKSLGYAEASMVIDNSDGKLPIEYNEVVVTRRIYRSGETGYFINKTPCRLKDVLELFMDTGIGKDGYSIIGQGKIEEILSNKSEDRRHIFEEAAGIVKYRTRKADSEKKLEQTKLNLLRINDIISEIENNIEPLKNQSEKAKKFLNLREELKNVEVGLFLYNIENFKNQIDDILENIEILETNQVRENENLNELQVKKEELKEQVDSLIEKIEETQNLGFEGNQKREQYNSEIGVLTERLSNNKENYERYAFEIEDLEKQNKELEKEQNQKLEKKNNLFTNKEKFEKELKEKEEELAKYSKTLSEKELEIESKKQIVQKNIDDKYEIVGEVNTEKANYENLEKREKSLKNEIQETISELDSTRTNKEESSKSFYELEKSKNSINNNLLKIKSEKDVSSQKLKDYDTKINTYQSEYRIKESRYKFLVETEKEKEGYAKSVKSLIEATEKDSSLAKGVHGVLANLISVDKKYELAIEMTLGASIQNIVTDTEEEAKKLVNYLRDNNLGRASFLPISSVKGQKVSGINTSKVDGIIGIASDLIKTDKKYNEIILSLLGRTVIVEDINSAIKLARQNSYKFKIVTLKGDVINPSGAISGGSVATKTASILGRGKEIKALEKELFEIKSKIEKLQAEKEKYENSISSLLEKFEEKQKEAQELEIVYATEKQKIDTIDSEIEKLDSKLSKLRIDLDNIKNEKEENILKQKELTEKVSKMDEENASLNIVIEEFTKLNRDNQKYIDDLNFDITNLKISVSSFDESEMSINEIMDRIISEMDKNTLSIQNKKSAREKIIVDNQELDLKIEATKQQIIDLEKEILESSDKVEKLKQERTNKNEKLNNVEKDIESQNEKIENLKNHTSKLDLKKSKIELELNQIINKMWEEYELTPNTVGDIEKIKNPTEVQKQVNSLRNEIRDLGSINVDAIKEYQELKERYDFMSEQRLDLEDSSSKLKKIISEMTETMKKQFAEQFKIINKNFGEVFTELFGGGKAELILADEENILECGIDIAVQPPGKKLQNMMLLSGGEKAFTAIALLFAILKMNPAPFCVLDEIEAALDDVNVYRFAEYLKKFSKDSQFLVITHRKGTMEAADTVYGITMEEKGISKLLSMKLK